MTADSHRCFLGLALPASVRESLAALGTCWRPAGLNGSWVREENFHITLRFLGDVTTAQLAALSDHAAPRFAALAPLRLALCGTGVFPHTRRPRVLWAGVSVQHGDLDALFDAAESSARHIGLAPENRRPAPHITLMRVRRNPDKETLDRFLKDTAALRSDAFEAGAVALWESTLRPGGAIYHKRTEFLLS